MKIERIVYFGTAPIAVPALRALHADPHSQVVAVCTQPDRPSGRKRKLTPSAVKTAAMELGLTVLDPEKIRDAEAELRDLDPDLGVVFAYGQYMPSAIFDLPKAGSVNFHPSLLPRYRGASPIQSAIANGDVVTGLSVIRVGKEMDAGELLMQQEVPIRDEDTSITLHDRFARMAAEWAPELLSRFRGDRLEWRPQDSEKVVECGRLTKEDGRVDWTLPAHVLCCRLRGYQPWPGLFFPLGEGVHVKVHEAVPESGSGEPGTVLEASADGLVVACGSGALRLLKLQPPGKTAMTAAAFLNGHALRARDRLPIRADEA